MSTLEQTPTDYRYDHVKTKTFMEDMYFKSGSPKPGEPLPPFDLPTTDGDRLSSRDSVGRKPLLLVTGSSTCPMTASSDPLLKQLHSEFGESVNFVMLHVREAHPGEQREQPETMTTKTRHARELKVRDGLPFPVLIDNPLGTYHQSLDEKPNAVWLADAEGIIVYRALFAGDETGLRQALEAAASGQKPQEHESRRKLIPMAMGIGEMQEMVRRSGPRAQADLIKAAPPMAAMAWVADQYRPLEPKWRGFAAMATFVGATVGLVALVRQQLASTPAAKSQWRSE